MVISTIGCPEKLTLTAEEYNQRGMSLAEQGKYNDAVKEYTKAIKLDPQNVDYYVNRGIAYLNMKEYDLAIADFDKAIELDPKNEVAYANRGCAYANKGGFYINLAIADFNMIRMLSKNPYLIEYAEEMLKNLTKEPPILVIPLPPEITEILPETPPEIPPVVTPQGETGGNTETWEGNFKMKSGYRESAVYYGGNTETNIEEITFEGTLSFEWVLSGYRQDEGYGSFTMTGTYYRYEEFYCESYFSTDTREGNFSTSGEVEVYLLDNGDWEMQFWGFRDNSFDVVWIGTTDGEVTSEQTIEVYLDECFKNFLFPSPQSGVTLPLRPMGISGDYEEAWLCDNAWYGCGEGEEGFDAWSEGTITLWKR
jgi:hypothetical protein